MRRFVWATLLVALLVSCQPAVQNVVTHTYNERLGHPMVELSLLQDEERGFVVLTLDYDDLTLADVAIAVRADSLQFNSEVCTVVPKGVDCTPGSIQVIDGEAHAILPPDKSPFILYFRGQNIVANASFYLFEDGSVDAEFYSELFVTDGS